MQILESRRLLIPSEGSSRVQTTSSIQWEDFDPVGVNLSRVLASGWWRASAEREMA